MGSARPAGRAFSPLDEELALLPGSLTPSLQESVTRLGTWMPFERAVAELAYFTRTVVSRPTVERITEAAGAAYVQLQTQEVERLERETPLPPAGPAKQFLSVDGANVPLVGVEWAEVKTLVIGEVLPPVQRRGEMVVETQNLSYFSRLTDSDTFQRLALVETHRRGVERAGQVAAVTDGAEWIQKFIDFHCPDAVRILDFPHAAERVALIGQGIWGEHAPETKAWLTDHLHQLKHDGPTPVLAELRRLMEQPPGYPTLQEHVTYLEKRQDAMQYPHFQAAGWPIGDGAVESGNKLVVEARLKGSGMHWARPHVDPMLALRNIACNDRWAEAWPQIMTSLRQQDRQRCARRRQKRPAQRAVGPGLIPAPPSVIPDAAQTPLPSSPASVMLPNAPDGQPCPVNPAPVKPAGPWRPPANHPWRHMPIGRARFKPFAKRTDAKT